jgi:hypothetical protein
LAKNEEVLEELYELLTLYFEFSPGGDLAKPFEKRGKVEPQLDRVIFKERLFAKISDTIMKLMAD